MSTTLLPRSAQPRFTRVPGTTLALVVLLTAWFAVVVVLGATGGFVASPGTPPLSLAIGFAGPIVAFFALLRLSRSFREFVLAADLRFMVAIQAWRLLGLEFLALYTHKVLPGLFALPAGLGDIAIGVTAPWLLLALIRRPRFAASPVFLAWNVLGMLDLIVAVGIGGLSAVLTTGASGEITTAPLAQLPLVLIPAFLVPIFFVLHVASLMQARRVAAGG
jgi:hypothetical protein